LTFKGTNYHGWQIQPNGISVQSILNRVLSLKLFETIEVVGAGRTDSGVHAKLFIAHFDTEKDNLGGNEQFLHDINSFLPIDITIKKIFQVNPLAHSRFSAISRTYEYYINNIKNSFSHDFSYYYHGYLDIYKMNEASKLLLNFNDFTSFCKLKSNSKTNCCKIFNAFWKEENDFIVFTIEANRFLRNMVRAIVGTLIQVGNGKLEIEKFIEIIEKKNRCSAGMSVPAHGLFLTGIKYPEELYIV
jgi:tRNA pseudouridine38-40 synthase